MIDTKNIVECISLCKKLLDKKNAEYKVLSKKELDNIQLIHISPGLCDFMNKPYNTKISQAEVLEYILNYIKINDLIDNNSKYIIPDDKLKNLFNIIDDEVVTFLNIQKYICLLY